MGLGEYVEEEVKVDVNPSWAEPPPGSASPYAYGREYSTSDFHILDTTPLFDRTDAESQDSGIGGSGSAEIDIKDHGVEGCSAARGPHPLAHNGGTDSQRRPSSRDPRVRKVSIAGPSSLYGRSSTPMLDPQNIASSGAIDSTTGSSDGEEKLVIFLGDE